MLSRSILHAKKLGFTPTQIRAMLPAADDAAQLTLKETQVLAQITQLERKRDELDTAIVELRDTHRRLTGDAAQAATAA